MSAGWNTVESDAGVFTYLSQGLGANDVQFEELVTLDADQLSRLSPVYGVILLFKYITDEMPLPEPKDGSFDYLAAEDIFFATQTIPNACGTQALLSVLLNNDGDIDVGPRLREFREFTAAFPSDLRGDALSNSDLIRDTHNSFARSSPFVDETHRGESTADGDVYHFIAYTAINNKLYELDGLQPAPITHGPCMAGELPVKVIRVLQRRIQRYPQTEIRFNLLAMVRDVRIRARELGDAELLQREEERRRVWIWENSLRQHNLVGFIGELVKGVVKSKVSEDEYDRWVGGSKQNSRQPIKGSTYTGFASSERGI